MIIGYPINCAKQQLHQGKPYRSETCNYIHAVCSFGCAKLVMSVPRRQGVDRFCQKSKKTCFHGALEVMSHFTSNSHQSA